MRKPVTTPAYVRPDCTSDGSPVWRPAAESALESWAALQVAKARMNASWSGGIVQRAPA